jgi:hypothetical protein
MLTQGSKARASAPYTHIRFIRRDHAPASCMREHILLLLTQKSGFAIASPPVPLTSHLQKCACAVDWLYKEAIIFGRLCV